MLEILNSQDGGNLQIQPSVARFHNHSYYGYELSLFPSISTRPYEGFSTHFPPICSRSVIPSCAICNNSCDGHGSHSVPRTHEAKPDFAGDMCYSSCIHLDNCVILRSIYLYINAKSSLLQGYFSSAASTASLQTL